MRIPVALLIPVLIVLAGCGSQNSGVYQPADADTNDQQSDVGDWDRSSDLDLGDIGEIPSGEGIQLDSKTELYVKILAPSSAPSFAVTSGEVTGAFAPTVVISGIALGAFDTLTVHSGTGDSVDVNVPEDREPSEPFFFSAPPVELNGPVPVGDVYEAQFTRVWVEASAGDTESFDVAVVVANPGFDFPSRLNRWPDALFMDESNDVVFTLDLNRVDTFDGEQVYLMETDAACLEKLPGSAKLLIDDGNTEDSGDELSQDRIYTKKLRLDYQESGTRMFRGSVKAQVGEHTLVAYTPCTPVHVVKRLTRATCQASKQVLQDAQAIFEMLLDEGEELTQAKKRVIAWLAQIPAVTDVGGGPDDALVWVRFTSGLLAAVQPQRIIGDSPVTEWPGTGIESAAAQRPTARIVSGTVSSEAGILAGFLEGLGCPPLTPAGSWGRLSNLHRLKYSGVAFFAAESGMAFAGLDTAIRTENGWLQVAGEDGQPAWAGWEHPGGQQLVWSQEPVNCEALTTQAASCFYQPDGTCCMNCTADPPQYCPSSVECLTTHSTDGDIPMGFIYDRTHIDLVLGRLVLGAETYGILPSFVQRYAGQKRGPDLAFLGFPNSLSNPQMAMEFLGAGADSIIGTIGYTSPESAEETGASLLGTMIENRWTPTETLHKVGASSAQHSWRLLGGGALDLGDSDLINLTFDEGDLKGWEHTGDARVLAFWCDQNPVDQYMALLSTGVGYTVQTGELRQSFCMMSNTLQFAASYTFISYEFEESCGSNTYLDLFQIFLEDELGQTQHLATTAKSDRIDINALCPCDAGECSDCFECGSENCQCGVLYHPDQGETLTAWSDTCSFDQGDAFTSSWRTLGPKNVTTMGDEKTPVTLVIQVSDRGDSKNDTTVLLDSLDFQ